MTGTNETAGVRPIGWRPVLADLLLVAAAVSLVLLATPWGIGVGYDSTFYLSAANGAVQGRGLGRVDASGDWIPLTHFPPLYPLTLAAGMLLTGAPAAGFARIASALLFGLNVLLVAGIARKWSRSRLVGAAAGIAFLLSPVVLERHLWAMSEASYFTCMLVTLGGLPAALRSERPLPLAALGLMAGLATLTRYVGVALVGCGLLAILLLDRRRWRRRAIRAAAFAASAAIPIAIWLLRNRLVEGELTNRSLIFHPLTREKIAEAARALAAWAAGSFLPWKTAAVVTGLLLVIGIVLSVRLVYQGLGTEDGRGEAPATPLAILLLHGLIYGAVLLVSLTFFDASTRLDNRILSPLYITFLLLIGVAGSRWLKRASLGWRVAVLGALAVLLAGYGWASADLVRQVRLHGLGFQSKAWRTSEGAAYAASLDPARPVYSNESIPLGFLLDRPVYAVPERLDPVMDRLRPDYPDQLSTMRNRVGGSDGVLLLFHPNSLRVEMPPRQELIQGLALVERLADAEVFGPEG